MKHLICAALAAVALTATAKKPADPTLMNVAGKNVALSEFEYLYHKNNTQQMDTLSPEQYLQMFIDYKLKVADAEAAGLDTTSTFRAEYLQYRDDLALPYMRDDSVRDSLINVAYSHYDSAVSVSHIMMPPTDAARAELDSLRTAILAGRTTFEEAARTHSVDNFSARRGGKMGNVNPGRFPWPFEKAAYDTPVGGISEPVNSGMGWHLVRVDSRKPSEGEVKAAHILRAIDKRLVIDSPERQKEIIDSLYTLAKNGARFSDLARQYSQDPGSGKEGGDLGWFGRGMMVQPFDSIAFALPDRGISEPFLTQFGWHIIYKEASRKGRSLDELLPTIEASMKRDGRADEPRKAYTARAIAERNGKVNASTLAALNAAIDVAPAGTALDSLMASPALASLEAFTLSGNSAKVATVAPRVAGVVIEDGLARSVARTAAAEALEAALGDAADSAAREDLMLTNADYRNLMNEYRDGILLFEIANSKVWDRASRDTEGLKAFFEANRDKYSWTAPHFKSYIIFATSDEQLAEALAYAATLDTADHSAFVEAMRKKFGRDVKVERVLAAKGDNAITDYLAFGGAKPEPRGKQWACYAAFGGRFIDAPEEPNDVRTAVISDYQTELEAEWVKSLRAKYPVKINKKTLKQIK